MILYTLRYLLILANTGFEQNYWDQIFVNDLWIKFLTEINKNEQ
jgi:hypothetical protein